MKSLFKTVALITIFSVMTRILGFVFRIILSRTVGAEGMGIYQVSLSVFMVLLTVISSGLPLIISRMSAGFSTDKDKKKSGSLISSGLLYALLLSLLLCSVVLIFKGLFSKIFTSDICYQLLLVLLPSLVFSSIYSVFRGAMWGKGNYFALCVTEFYEQLVHIVLGTLLIGNTLSAAQNALNLGWSMTIACLLSAILVMLLFFYYGGSLKKPSRQYLRPLIKQSSPITAMRVAGSFIQPIVALIIPARLIAIGYTNAQALSLYGIAVGMTLPLIFIPTTIIGSLSTALVPDLSKAAAQNDQSHIEKRITSSVFFALLISSMFVPMFLGMGEQIGLFLYDNILSGTLLQSAAWVLLPLGLTNISSALLNSLGFEKRTFLNYAIGAACMLLSLWFLPALIGVNSIMWGMGISYLVTATLNIILLKRKTKANFNMMFPLLKLCLIILPSSALTAFVVSLCEYVFPMFISICIGVFVSLTSFFLLAGVIGFVDIRLFFVNLKQRLQSSRKKKKPKHA